MTSPALATAALTELQRLARWIRDDDQKRCVRAAEVAAIALAEGNDLPDYDWHDDGAWFVDHPAWVALYVGALLGKLADLRAAGLGAEAA